MNAHQRQIYDAIAQAAGIATPADNVQVEQSTTFLVCAFSDACTLALFGDDLDSRESTTGSRRRNLGRRFAKNTLFAMALVSLPGKPVLAQDLPSEVTLFKNVNVFDGTTDTLLEGHDVLVVRNMIEKLAKDIPPSGTYTLDAKTGGLRNWRRRPRWTTTPAMS